MFLHAIAKKLENDGIALIGDSLFVYSAPAEKQNYILLMLNGDGVAFDPQTPGYYNTKYQVIIRYVNYEDGLALAQTVKEALHFYNQKYVDIVFKHSIPRDEPRPFRRNDAGIIEISNNFLASFVKE